MLRSHAIDRGPTCGSIVAVPSGKKQRTRRGKKKPQSIRRKRKSIISRVRLPRSIKFVKFRRENNARFARPAPSSVGPPSRALRAEGIVVVIVGDSGGKKETCWRRHYRYLISRSLARPAVPLECCLCTHPLSQSSPRRAWDCSYAFLQRRTRCWRRITLWSLSPGTHRGHTYAFTRINRGCRDNRAQWVNYYRVATWFAKPHRVVEAACIGWHYRTLMREEAIVCVRIRGTALTKDLRKKAASMSAAPVVLQNRIEMDVVDRAKSKWNEQDMLHRIKER